MYVSQLFVKMRFCLDRLHQINADPSGNTPVNVRLKPALHLFMK